MTRLHEPDGADGGGSEWEPQDPPSDPFFDPLFAPWPRPAAPEPLATFGDPLFALEAAPKRPAEPTDEPWSVPPGSPYSPEHTPGLGYPDRFHPLYEQRMTELQRRLRDETITIPRPSRRWVVTIRELAETLLLALLIFMAVRASFQNFRVEGASMQPSLENGEYLIVNKLSYTQLDFSFLNWLPFFDAGDDPMRHLWGSPARGDVIVFRAPTSINRDFIKRIIGVPGDTVVIDDGTGAVTVNGQTLTEAYIQGTTHCGTPNQCTIEVPPADTAEARARCGANVCYFVMGDNRQNSSDSRQGWLVPEENIIGKALITYWHQGGPELDLAPNHSIGVPAAASSGD